MKTRNVLHVLSYKKQKNTFDITTHNLDLIRRYSLCDEWYTRFTNGKRTHHAYKGEKIKALYSGSYELTTREYIKEYIKPHAT